MKPSTPRGVLPAPALAAETSPIPFVRPHVAVDASLLATLAAVLRSGHLSNDGPQVRALEAALSACLGHTTLCTHSGFSALQLAVRCVRRPGAIVVPAFTFVASANAVRAEGRAVYLCDVDAAHWTLCPAALDELLRARGDVAAVMAVNVYGEPADLDALLRVCAAHDVDLLLDNAHGMGSSLHGRPWPVGVRAAAHSMHATKVLPAAEGGFVALAPDVDAEPLRQARNHGLGGDPKDAAPGINAKLSDLHAALALHGLQDLDAVIEGRRATLARLRALVAGLCADEGEGSTLQLPAPRLGAIGNGQNFAVAVGDGDAVGWQAALARHGVGSRRYFHPSLSAVGYLASGQAPTPIADDLAARVLALPLWSRMPEPTVAAVEAGLAGAFAERRR